MKTFEAIIYVKNQIRVMIDAEDEDEAMDIVEQNISEGNYDDQIAEAVGSYSETHIIDIVEC